MLVDAEFFTYRTDVDPLSDVLRDLRLESTVFCVLALHAPWGLAKDRLDGAPFHIVVEGRCWIQVEGEAPMELTRGDLVVLPHGDAHVLSSSPAASTVPFRAVLRRHGVTEAWAPGLRVSRLLEIRHGSARGEMARVVSGVFAFRDRRRNPVLEALPRLIRMRAEHGRGTTWLDAALQLLLDETLTQAPGAATVVERTADILFVQAVRAHIASSDPASGGWLRGLLDPAIGLALSLVHARPGAPWTIESLGREVGLSRTVFAQRFRTLVGETVMVYVTRIRMHLAAGLLCAGSDGLSRIAQRVGYESEVTFSKAFRAWAGEPPGRYRRRMSSQTR
jgi:AraC-like DNA-binding protein